MSKRNKHKMSENFQSEENQEKEILNSAEQDTETAQGKINTNTVY